MSFHFCYNIQDLETLISPYGVVVSTRILRDQAGASRGVGFARSVNNFSNNNYYRGTAVITDTV